MSDYYGYEYRIRLTPRGTVHAKKLERIQLLHMQAQMGLADRDWTFNILRPIGKGYRGDDFRKRVKHLWGDFAPYRDTSISIDGETTIIHYHHGEKMSHETLIHYLNELGFIVKYTRYDKEWMELDNYNLETREWEVCKHN